MLVFKSNAELVSAIYRRFRAGDDDEALALIRADIELHDRPEIPDPQVYRGHEGVLRSLQLSREAFDDLDVVPEDFLEVGDHVVVVMRFQGTGRESGVPVDERLCHLWTIRDGKAARMEVIADREAALRAAGAARPPAPSAARPPSARRPSG